MSQYHQFSIQRALIRTRTQIERKLVLGTLLYTSPKFLELCDLACSNEFIHFLSR